MPRETFGQELQRLQDQVLTLGNMVEKAVAGAVDTLKRRDSEGARRLISEDCIINEKRFHIEAECLALIATQQPMAGDLRILAAVLDIAGELERMADYAKGIAEITLMMGEQPLLKPLIDVPRMADKVLEMLRQGLDAFIRRDAELARTIPFKDGDVDVLYDQILRELLTIMGGDPSTIDRGMYLLWVAHNLERTADRVTNICERVVFSVTGEMLEMDVGNRMCPTDYHPEVEGRYVPRSWAQLSDG
jgi:phosphate transport system protein